jgi:cleavage and polyadenylation specificity factor subunit 3
MFIEAQFGADALTPIAEPRLPRSAEAVIKASDSSSESDESDDLEKAQKLELERLHRLGIPVPGIEIKVDKMVAKVWLEDLEVECSNRVFAERVKVILERATEVVAPLWMHV